jgi:hypothetical protein
MFSSLHSARGLAASLALGCFVFHAVAPAFAADLALASTPHTQAEITLESEDETLIAHHGGEGTGSVLPGAVGAPAVAALKGNAIKSVVSNSLWGNMLLNMAYQMDPEIQKIATRAGRVNALTLLSLTGVTGLGLAQSIYAYRDIELTVGVTPAHHPGGSDHVHLPPDSRVPSTLGIIGSGVTLATLGINAAASKHYSRRMKQRQIDLRNRVDTVLAQLTAGGQSQSVQSELVALVGPLAAEEFLMLWNAVHK